MRRIYDSVMFILFAVFVFLGSVSTSSAQPTPVNLSAPVMVNRAATVTVTPGCVMIVNGALQNDGLYFPSAGAFTNDGEIFLRTAPGDGTFSMVEKAITRGDGIFHVEQDWFCSDSSQFDGGKGTVMMDKGSFGTATLATNNSSEQFIAGNSVTVFNNLMLSESGTGSKVFLKLNAETGVNGTLSLFNRELAAYSDTFKVNNPDPSAITRDDISYAGFVSTDGGGQLVRNTNLQTSYFYPLGSTFQYDGRANATRFRPLEVIPNDYGLTCYGARLINHDANGDGRSTTASAATGINANYNINFYHEVTRNCGSANADLNFFYNPLEDGGEYSAVGFYDTQKNMWRSAGTSSAEGDGNPFLRQKRAGWAFLKPEDKYFILYNEEGLVDSIPNVMTMNGDGLNDILHIRNAHISEFSMKIYNRWGTMLFETTSPQIDWDGKTLAGVEVPEGTYFYILKALTQTDEKISKRGFITLLK